MPCSLHTHNLKPAGSILRSEGTSDAAAVSTKSSSAALELANVLLPTPEALSHDMQDKVSVSFYAEALCPYCALATTSVVAPIFESGLATFTDFRYIPSGNAKNGSQVSTHAGTGL